MGQRHCQTFCEENNNNTNSQLFQVCQMVLAKVLLLLPPLRVELRLDDYI